MNEAFEEWQTRNLVKLVDPTLDALYNYDSAVVRKETESRPWRNNARHFKHVRVSAVAMIKMVMHATSGGDIEVMGCMQGYISGDTFIVTDALPLPVEGTETRVNAQDEANEYLVQYLKACRENGRQENVVGWYHSHPGYGCWLSGIDVETQKVQQQFNDPFLAIVIDPHRTMSSGKVDIGAFRTLPEQPAGAPASMRKAGDDGDVPSHKAADFGAHASKYYSLEVSHYKSTLDMELLELLWSRYWVQTLTASTNNRGFAVQKMEDLSVKLTDTTKDIRKSCAHVAPAAFVTAADKKMEAVVKVSRELVAIEKTGVTALGVKKNLFSGMGLSKLG
ncbi:hypothetical protein TD95_002028 [Thielaviopsis punctulata]|uniref:COP9 signalosome complex subunit 5 n=1 Tax=Thielaviopsis punctulata TaxID=72032 RepID=A0A0F4ZBA0_9PEZI|nr:hypothetical protein TD95_002028 [Thielaviopsis punctulata]